MLRSIIYTGLAALALLGCGDDTAVSADARGPAVDGRPVDAPLPDATACTGDALDCATWIESYEREIVSKLSGNEMIAPGVTLLARSTTEQRDAARNYIRDELNAHGLTAQLHNYGTGSNVYVELPATNGSNEVIVLGAHFDSIPGSPAAADDGTGTALVLAAARFFGSLPTRSATLVIAFFDQEEEGLLGSQAFSDKLRLEGTNLVAMHNFDMISYDGDGDGAVELWSPAPQLQALYEQVAAELNTPVRVVDFGSSDHASFSGDGFDVVGVCEEFVSGDHTPHYHTPQDTYDKIDFSYLLKITRLAFTAIGRSLE